jgi:hypothetical protein
MCSFLQCFACVAFCSVLLHLRHFADAALESLLNGVKQSCPMPSLYHHFAITLPWELLSYNISYLVKNALGLHIPNASSYSKHNLDAIAMLYFPNPTILEVEVRPFGVARNLPCLPIHNPFTNPSPPKRAVKTPMTAH